MFGLRCLLTEIFIYCMHDLFSTVSLLEALSLKYISVVFKHAMSLYKTYLYKVDRYISGILKARGPEDKNQ